MRQVLQEVQSAGGDLSTLPPTAVAQLVAGANGIVAPGTPVTTDVVNAQAAFDAFFQANCPTTPKPTPPGTNIGVQPVDPVTGTSPVAVTFSNVTAPGATSLTSSAVGPLLPAGFQLGNPAIYYDVSTTAAHTGPITLCFGYDPVAYPGGASLCAVPLRFRRELVAERHDIDHHRASGDLWSDDVTVTIRGGDRPERHATAGQHVGVLRPVDPRSHPGGHRSGERRDDQSQDAARRV